MRITFFITLLETAFLFLYNVFESGFNIAHAEKKPLVITSEQMWENYKYFIKAVMPAAEKAGVKMALHPDDPPIPELLGYSRIFINADSYRRAMRLFNQPLYGGRGYGKHGLHRTGQPFCRGIYTRHSTGRKNRVTVKINEPFLAAHLFLQ